MTAQFLRIQGELVWQRAAIGDFGTRLTVTIQACIDDDDLNVLRKRLDDKSILKKYEELQDNYDRLQEDNRKLKLQLESLKKTEDKQQIIHELSSNEKIYRANNYMMEFYRYDMSDSDYISKGRDLLNKIHVLLDKDASMPAAIPLYLDSGVNELTLETCQDTKKYRSLDAAFERTDDPIRRDQLRHEFMMHEKNQAQRYYDIATHYISFAEALPDHPDYAYKKYGAMESYYGYKAIALKMMGDDKGASRAIEHAESCLSRIPASSIYHEACLANLQAIKENIQVQ